MSRQAPARAPLRVAVAAQPPCVPYDVEANAATHAAAIRAARARVVVFPELSLTGYQLDAEAIIDAYLAGTVMDADEVATQDERARRTATAYGVWVAVASFAGSTGEGYDHTAGHSGVWAPGGALVVQAGPGPGAIAHATLA
jgi:predicted amidohydrolase